MSSTQVLNQQPVVEVPIKVETDETPVSVPVEEKPKTKTSVLNAQFLQETMTRPDKYLSSFPSKMYYPKRNTSIF